MLTCSLVHKCLVDSHGTTIQHGFGFMVRLPQCSPDVKLQYGKWKTPRNVNGRMFYFHQSGTNNSFQRPYQTPVGILAYLMHTDPTIFAEPYEFRPEGWLEGQVISAMKQAYVPFSKGSRACLGSIGVDVHFTIHGRSPPVRDAIMLQRVLRVGQTGELANITQRPCCQIIGRSSKEQLA